MKEIFAQIIITCTTINVVIILSTLTAWIGFKISDRRRKKEAAEKQSQENKH